VRHWLRVSRAVPIVIAALVAIAGCGRIGFDPVTGTGVWFDRSWAYRKALVIDHTKVGGDLADFPVLVDLVDPDLARASGPDLVFVDATGHVLAHELELFQASPVHLVAWVKLPAIAMATDTTFYVYYGNPSAADQQQVKAVWSSYASVYHFASGALTREATGANQGINQGATSATGKILDAASFASGTNLLAPVNGVDATPGALTTVTFWLYYHLPYGQAAFAFLDPMVGGYDLWMEADGCFGFNTENGDVIGTAALGQDKPVERWVHVAATFYNGTPDAVHNQLYLDGVAQSLAPCTGGIPQLRQTSGAVLWASGNGYQLNGLIDEGRIFAGVRSPAWIRTEYLNQVDASAFVAAGLEEQVP